MKRFNPVYVGRGWGRTLRFYWNLEKRSDLRALFLYLNFSVALGVRTVRRKAVERVRRWQSGLLVDGNLLYGCTIVSFTPLVS